MSISTTGYPLPLPCLSHPCQSTWPVVGRASSWLDAAGLGGGGQNFLHACVYRKRAKQSDPAKCLSCSVVTSNDQRRATNNGQRPATNSVPIGTILCFLMMMMIWNCPTRSKRAKMDGTSIQLFVGGCVLLCSQLTFSPSPSNCKP